MVFSILAIIIGVSNRETAELQNLQKLHLRWSDITTKVMQGMHAINTYGFMLEY